MQGVITIPEAPNYITVKDAAGTPVAFLSPEADGISDCQVNAQLNGQCEMTFKVPLTSDKAAILLPEYTVETEDRSFLLLAPSCLQRVREKGTKRTWLQATIPERWVELAKRFVTVAADGETDPVPMQVIILASDLGQGGFSAGSAGSALHRLLQGSGWTVGTVDVIGTHDLETERLNLLQNIQKVQEIWGGYLVWDSKNKTVSLRDETAWQPGSGVEFRYTKNLQGAERDVDADLVTRLYCFGQDGLTIASVNGGQLYIDDNHYTDAIYEGIYENQEIDDPDELLEAALKALPAMAEPRVTYRLDLTDLSALPDYVHEDFYLGDVVRARDPELGFDAQVRVVGHTYQVFQPWKATVELGDRSKDFAQLIAGAVSAADFVKRALRPNPGTSNLLKGFINTFTSQIKSANGKLRWNDSALEAVEIDGSGNETGRRVQITPGGIGISTDGGLTYSTAMTGQGILANAVIVSDLYALASDDGYTRLKGDGLHVFDALNQERVHVGRWLIGMVEHYGIRIFANDGTVLLDDRGSLQTWERGHPDNVDSTHPHRIKFFLPPEVLEVKRILLRFSREPFRAYETGAASGGGSLETTTTEALRVLSTTTEPQQVPSTSTEPQKVPTSAPGVWSLTSYPLLGDYMNVSGNHGHGIPSGTALATAGGGSVTFSADGAHAHSMYSVYHVHNVTIPSHNHTVTIPSHYHYVTVPSHYHTVSVPSHSHPLVFGIYEGATPGNITVKINGVDRTAALGGPFNSDQTGLNIAPYVQIGVNNVIEVGANGLGRIDASVFIQVHLGV